MPKQALIAAGVVTNIIAYDPGANWRPPDGAILADIPDADGNLPQIGLAYTNDRFEQPEPEVEPATRAAVNRERARLFRLGATVDLGGGLVVPVDTRDQDDLTNIQGLTSFGILKMVQQESGTFTFGGADDVEYELTYPQLIEIGLTAMARRDAIWKASRAVKAQIEAGTLTDAADIPAAFDALLRPPDAL